MSNLAMKLTCTPSILRERLGTRSTIATRPADGTCLEGSATVSREAVQPRLPIVVAHGESPPLRVRTGITESQTITNRLRLLLRLSRSRTREYERVFSYERDLHRVLGVGAGPRGAVAVFRIHLDRALPSVVRSSGLQVL